MKKKNIRESRKAEKQKRSEIYLEIQRQKKNTVIEAENIYFDIKHQQLLDQFSHLSNSGISSETEEIIKKRSHLKSVGVKSIFVTSKSSLLITGYGKGWQSVPEIIITDATIQKLRPVTPLHVSIDAKDKDLCIETVPPKSFIVKNPLKVSGHKGDDQIHCKSKLEMVFFGKTFHDNIHIQLIYNILDIEKILSVYVNHAVYAINNILHTADEEYSDYISSFGLYKTYEKFMKQRDGVYSEIQQWFLELTKCTSRRYFGKLFLESKQESGYKYKQPSADPKWIYYYLCLLGMIRQSIAHGRLKTQTQIYTLDECFDEYHGKDKLPLRMEARFVLHRLYREVIYEVNNQFLRLASKDLQILFKAYQCNPEKEAESIVQDYYRFSILKEHKSMGISMRVIRLYLVSNYLRDNNIRDEEIRKRLYRIIDFIVYRYYLQFPNEAERLILQLRSSGSEQNKKQIYANAADQIWRKIGSMIRNDVMPYISRIVLGRNPGIRNLTGAVLSKVSIEPDANGFCQLMLLLSQFLGSSESKEMMVQLADKMEMISDLFDLLKSQQMDTTIVPYYRIFTDSAEMARDLRIISSISHMGKQNNHGINLKKLFFDVGKIFGFPGDDDQLREYIQNRLIECQQPSGNTYVRNTRFRNFVSTHIISLPAFNYLTRYANMDKARDLINNPVVNRFVLETFSEDEINTYYSLCIGENALSLDEQRSALNQLIQKTYFPTFETIDSENSLQKRNQAKLYLEVMYRLLNGLVNVNSRYFLAFHCAERDSVVYSSEYAKSDLNNKDYAAFAMKFISEHETTSRLHQAIIRNCSNSTPWDIRNYRNCVAHLGAIKNANKYIGDIKSVSSYFAIYHFLVQRYLLDKFRYDHRDKRATNKSERKTYYYLHYSEEHGVYCKDYVKALCTPFAYQASRYQSLTVEKLFVQK